MLYYDMLLPLEQENIDNFVSTIRQKYQISDNEFTQHREILARNLVHIQTMPELRGYDAICVAYTLNDHVYTARLNQIAVRA